jgi:hypothetical protein
MWLQTRRSRAVAKGAFHKTSAIRLSSDLPAIECRSNVDLLPIYRGLSAALQLKRSFFSFRLLWPFDFYIGRHRREPNLIQEHQKCLSA